MARSTRVNRDVKGGFDIMSQRRGTLHLLLPLLALMLLVTGCPKRPATTAASAPAPTASTVAPAPTPPSMQPAPAAPSTPSSPSMAAPATPAPATAAPATPPRPSEFAENANLRDVYFDFDKYDIRPDDANNLVLIEGHCDERGTNEYNLALGERRAKATMNYLVSQGIQANRITIISYGKERPVCSEKNEACWQKNRRAHFLVKAR
jgi:peptidoglycan-associated lipoprotein